MVVWVTRGTIRVDHRSSFIILLEVPRQAITWALRVGIFVLLLAPRVRKRERCTAVEEVLRFWHNTTVVDAGVSCKPHDPSLTVDVAARDFLNVGIGRT